MIEENLYKHFQEKRFKDFSFTGSATNRVTSKYQPFELVKVSYLYLYGNAYENFKLYFENLNKIIR